jgi:hypothetical protein
VKKAVFWVVVPCSLVDIYQHFRGACCLHHQDDGGSKDLWNSGKLVPDYMTLQSRRQPSSYSPPWEIQIRLILCNIKEAYLSFRHQNTEKLLGFSKFASYRQKTVFWLEGVVCMQFVCVPFIRMWNLWFQMQNCMIGLKSRQNLRWLSKTICNLQSVSCYQGDCEMCPGTENLIKNTEHIWRQQCIQYNLQTVNDYWQMNSGNNCVVLQWLSWVFCWKIKHPALSVIHSFNSNVVL